MKLRINQLEKISIKIIFILTLINSSLFGQKKIYDLSYYDANHNKLSYSISLDNNLQNLKGDVKELTEIETTIEYNTSRKTYYRFDANKKIIEYGYKFMNDPSIKMIYRDYKNDKKNEFYHYDSNGNVTQEEFYYYNNNLIVNKSLMRKFDANRKLIGEEVFYFDEQNKVFKKEYTDKVGEAEKLYVTIFEKNPYELLFPLIPFEHLGQIKYKRISNNIDTKTEVIFDKDYNFISEKTYNLKNTLLKSKEVTYYKEHLRKTEFYQDFEEKYSQLFTYEYEDNGFLTKSRESYRRLTPVYENDSKKPLEEGIYEYDSTGKSHDGYEGSVHIYENDIYGNVLKSFDGNDTTKLFGEHIYEYDSVGNWTKKTSIHNGKPMYIMIREIKYY